MKKFIKDNSAQMSSATAKAATKLDIDPLEQKQGHKSFTEVMAFLDAQPASISSMKAPFGTQDFFDKAAVRFYKGRFRKELPKTPKTVADAMVGNILQTVFGYSSQKASGLVLAHQRAMAAENAVGNLLERYIASVLEPKGWTWCSGTLVATIDFVRYDQKHQQWDILQIKNRDNSENSSSAAHRIGRNIPSWFRTFSKTGLTNWDTFPILKGADKKLLSESGFKQFVEEFYESIKKSR